jgi:hypothetical protein
VNVHVCIGWSPYIRLVCVTAKIKVKAFQFLHHS